MPRGTNIPMRDSDSTRMFEQARPQLLGLAYRLLGSRADGEDAVQDTFIKWNRAQKAEIEQPAAWLTTVCTRRCLDLLRSADKSRVDYVGVWLPEPIQTAVEPETERGMELAASLTTAFLLLLQRLTPKERAAYLLHDIFELSYADIAETLDMRESACRKLVSRAKANIGEAKQRHQTPIDRQERLLAAFRAAVESGETAQLADLLSDDIRLGADGGGKVPAIPDVLAGKADVLHFIGERLSRYWADFEWMDADINGGRAFLLRQDGMTVATVSFAYDDAGQANGIYIMRNPDKLTGLAPLVIQ